ncbi:ComF operon protein 1, partial [Paenibacillus sp. FSL R7-277]
MKVAVYVVAQGGEWQARISLNLAVDELWWAGEAEGVVGWENRVVLLSRSLPLGWAVKLAAAWKFTNQMQRWDEAAWRKYAAVLLKAEIRAERAAGEKGGTGWPFEEAELFRLPEDRGWSGDGEFKGIWGHERREGWNGKQMVGEGCEWGDEPRSEWASRINSGGAEERGNEWGSTRESWLEDERVIERGSRRENWRGNEQVSLRRNELKVLAAGADRLVAALDGRSLLQGEAEALVAEQLPELAENWRAAAQLAYLQGRLRLTAAVLGPAGAARLGLRRREVPRCLRCGSVPTGRTACAACGLAGCAYCEACLALGRSRA